MARYLIPNYKVAELQKKIQRIRNKGAQVVFDVINDHVAVPAESFGQDMTLDCSEIEISGKYKINGWAFVATIEHGSPENIIRLADYSFEGRVPSRYRTARRDCEHCHIQRERADTYLVYNEDTDDFKQVGRTCLRNYTNGLDAETCASLASVVAEINRLNDEVENDDFDTEIIRDYSQYIGYPMEKARKQAYKYVERHGYISGVTGHEFADELSRDHSLAMATDAEVQNVTDYLQSSGNSDYIANARAAWNKDQYKSRDASLITSAVSSYFKQRDREAAIRARAEERAAAAASRDNSFAGEVGDSVTFTVSDFRVLYWRSGGPSYRASEYPVYRILGADNRVYIWGCSSAIELHEGDTLKGKIKKQITRPDGELQTEVTRCRVINSTHQDLPGRGEFEPNDRRYPQSETQHRIPFNFTNAESQGPDGTES